MKTPKTEAEWFAWMTRRRVKLGPVIDKKGVLFWYAGYTVLSSAGWQNIVNTQAQGDTPIEALSNLHGKVLTIRGGMPVKKKSPVRMSKR
jgi:hypothetical protein